MDGTTVILADAMNDFNRLHYTVFNDPADLATARRTLLNGMDKITNSLAADVALSSTGTYFTGPTVAQGTSGTWLASGTITVVDTAQGANIFVKLWDGTTVIASAAVQTSGANIPLSVSLSGYLASPAGNIRISARDASVTTGKILYDSTGSAKDSTLSAIRIA